MAIFYPPLEEIRQFRKKPEEGELHLLEFLTYLDDDYEVFFNSFLNGDRPDVVIMKRDGGVLIIEVKDINLANYYLDEKNRWRVRANGRLARSPLDQVLKYKENLYELHVEELLALHLKNYKYWYVVNCAVYFHKARQSQAKAFLLSGDNPHDRYQTFLEGFTVMGWDSLTTAYFDAILRQKYLKGRTSKYFTGQLYTSFLRHLRPSVQFNPSPRRIEYTNEQLKLTVSREGAQKIRGVAGCGKTQILAQRAVNAFQRTGQGGRVLILTYNLTLINYIRDRINELRREHSPDDFYITNYHDFISAEMNNLGLEFDLPEAFEDYTARQKAAFFARYYQNTRLFEEVKDQVSKYAVVLIDEVQDYKYEWLELVRKYFLADHGEYVLFGDEKQNIYNNELEEQAPRTNVRGRWHYLTNTFRLSEAVSDLAVRFQGTFFGTKYQLDARIAPLQGFLFVGKADNGVIQYCDCTDSTIAHLAEQIYAYARRHGIQPNDMTILTLTAEMGRVLDAYIRYRFRERTHKMFETQEVYYKTLLDTLDALDMHPFIGSGLMLFGKGAARKGHVEMDKSASLAKAITMHQMITTYQLDGVRPEFEAYLEKYQVREEAFLEWVEAFHARCADGHFYRTRAVGKRHRARLERVRKGKKKFFFMNPGMVRMSTVHSFKGWETPTLFLVLEPGSGSDAAEDQVMEELVYTGITRCRSNLFLLDMGHHSIGRKLKGILETAGH